MVCFLASPVTAQDPDALPSAESVIEDFVDALGGEMVLSSIESCRIKGRVAGPVAGEMDVRCKNNNWLVEMQYSAAGRVTYGSVDGVSWMQTGERSTRKLAEGDLTNAIQSLNMTNLLFRSWTQFAGQIELVGQETYRDQDTWHLRFTGEDGSVVDRFFDRESRLLVGCKYEVQGSGYEWAYEFSEVEGMLWVTRAAAYQDNGEYELTWSDFDLDTDIDDAVFAWETDDR